IHGDGERLNVPRIRERVDLDQELAVEVHARDGVRAELERDAADDPVVGGGVDVDVDGQVQRAGQGAEGLDLRADRTGDREVRAAARAGGGDRDEAVERDGAEMDRGLDGGGDVDLAAGRRVGARLAVKAGRGRQHGDLRRIARLQ